MPRRTDLSATKPDRTAFLILQAALLTVAIIKRRNQLAVAKRARRAA